VVLAVTPAAPAEATRRGWEDRQPLRPTAAVAALARCVLATAELLARGQVHLPRGRIGLHVAFADGTTSRVYRETTVDNAPESDRCVLVVAFRLRAVRGRGHRAFEVESLFNTPLFVGFTGFVSKLWLAADANGVYRGLYEWDRPELADAYVRALWWVLALVSVRGSIHYRVVPGIGREDVLRCPSLLDRIDPAGAATWWRITHVE
jgi:hypothetical protein